VLESISMQKSKKDHLLKIIGKEIVEARKREMRAREYFRVYQNASRSEEGDRANAEAVWNLAKHNLKRIEDFLKAAEKISDSHCSKIASICFVNTDRREFYFANESFRLDGILVIGANSP